MTYTIKYLAKVNLNPPKSRAGLRPKQENWGSEQVIIERDRYYAYLKHKAQAKYRGENHELTAEQWCELWTMDRWLCRGRGKNDLCLSRVDLDLGWTFNNCTVKERTVYLKRASEYRERKDGNI